MVRSHFRRVAVATALAAVIAVVSVFVYSSRGTGRVALPPFTTARIARGDVIQSVDTTGQLAPLVSVEVSTQISGLVTQVNVDFNSEVKSGQLLARIDPSTYQQRLRQAQADLAAAGANVTLAKVNARRLKGLRDQDLVSQAEYDAVEVQAEQADALLQMRRAAVENARVDLDRCAIYSPIDGVVIFRQIEVGKTIQASFSAPTLFVIARDLQKMRIIAPISEVDVRAVHPGQSVTFGVDAIPNHTFAGRLTQIRSSYVPTDKQQPPTSNPVVTFDGVIEVDNQDLLLRPNLTANVSIIVRRHANVLSIPNGALRLDPAAIAASVDQRRSFVRQRGESRVTIYRLPPGDRYVRPEPVEVELGISDGVVTEVLDGLRVGDTIVTGRASTVEIPRTRSIF